MLRGTTRMSQSTLGLPVASFTPTRKHQIVVPDVYAERNESVTG